MSMLVDEVRERIRSRYCGPEFANTQIPTERQLVEELDVSRATIRKAMRDLETSGLLRRYQGRGTFVMADADGRQTGAKLREAENPTIAIIGRGTLSRQANAAWVTAALDRTYQRELYALMSLSHGDPVREFELIQQALNKPVDGILIQPGIDEHYSARLRQHMGQLGSTQNIPMVTLGDSSYYPMATSVWFDEFAAGYLAGRHLVELGHRHIAIVKSSQSRALQNRIRGFVTAVEEAGLGIDEQNVIDLVELPRSSTHKLGRMAATLLLSRPQRPTAIFAYWIELAAGVMMEALDRGLKVPQDLALMGVGIHLFTETRQQLPLDITTITYDEPKLAEYAIDLLHAKITGGDAGPNPALEPTLVPASSTVPEM